MILDSQTLAEKFGFGIQSIQGSIVALDVFGVF